MRITLFSVDEANRLLPRLRPELERLVALKAEHDTLTPTELLAGAWAGADDPPGAFWIRARYSSR